MSPRELYEHLHTAAFNEDVTYAELIHVALAFAVFWYFAFEIGKFLLGKWSYGKPWLKACCEREFDRNEGMYRRFLGNDKSRDELVCKLMKDWPEGIVMNLQHFAGGALCIPSLIGYGDPAWASSLACLGILSEMGWEIEDTVLRLYQRLRYGKEKVPNAMMIILAVHHAPTSILGPFVILAYRNLRTLHWLCFDLQIVGVLAVLGEYAKFLDVTKQPDLMHFKVINFILLVIMVWTRAIHWVYCAVDIYITWWNDEKWSFMVIGGVIMLLFSCFNAFFCVLPTWKRFLKFLHKSAEYEALPKDAPSEDRRKSVVAMSEAAALLLDVPQDPADAMAEYLLEALEEKPAKEIERRQTMNLKSSATRSKSLRMMKYMSVPAEAKFKGA